MHKMFSKYVKCFLSKMFSKYGKCSLKCTKPFHLRSGTRSIFYIIPRCWDSRYVNKDHSRKQRANRQKESSPCQCEQLP